MLSKHLLKDPDHGNQGAVQSGGLPIHCDAEQIHIGALVPQLSHKLGDDPDVGVVVGVVEPDGVDQADELFRISIEVDCPQGSVLGARGGLSRDGEDVRVKLLARDLVADFPVPVFPMMRSVLTGRSFRVSTMK